MNYKFVMENQKHGNIPAMTRVMRKHFNGVWQIGVAITSHLRYQDEVDCILMFLKCKKRDPRKSNKITVQ